MRYDSMVLCFAAILTCFCSASASLFPEQIAELQAAELLMPNIERSLRDCPFTIYEQGGYGLASSIFSERYVDKSFSHTVKVLNGDQVCVGMIVDENHVLAMTDCISNEDELLPEVKLANETVDPIEAVESFPNFNYNVTLLRLNSTIEVTKLGVPACFWNVPFEDGFDKIQSIFTAPNGSLAVKEVQCTFQNRKECMYDLLKTSNMLQTRVIADYRMHPFVFAFGTNDEGLAVPVSEYVEWMETITERKINSSECLSTYNDFREYEDSMVSRSENYQSVQYSKSRLSTTTISQYKVRILPNTTELGTKRHCYGSLIGPKFILTAANCLKQYDAESYNVEMAQMNTYYPVRDDMIQVQSLARKVHYHPQFDATTLANDIALLELENPIYNFNNTLVPACVWPRDKLPSIQYQTNGYVPFDETDDAGARTKQRYAVADLYEDCVEKEAEHKVCAGFPTALAPNTCHNSIGSAMSRSLFVFSRYFEFIFAINSRGENCGFNMPTVYTRIAPYVQWIDSVIYAPKVQYEDNTKLYGDRCRDENGTEGTCVSLENCPKLIEEVKRGQVLNSSSLCSFGKQSHMVVCCSGDNMLRNETYREKVTQAVEELDRCPHLHHEFRKNKSPYKVDNFPIFPYMVLIHDKDDRSCNGTLVSKQYVLTTMTCYNTLGQNEITVVAGNDTQQHSTVTRTFAHPEFNGVPMEFNLMLLKLNTAITINNETIPACLWQNQTHTPLRLEEVYANPNFTYKHRFPLFNEACQKKYGNGNVTSLQLCVDIDKMYYEPFSHVDTDRGNPLVSHFAQGVNEYQVTYIVGLYGSSHSVERLYMENDDTSDRDDGKFYYNVYQRISEYYNWIKNVIIVDLQNEVE